MKSKPKKAGVQQMVSCITRNNVFLTFVNRVLVWSYTVEFLHFLGTESNFECRLRNGEEKGGGRKRLNSEKCWAVGKDERITNTLHHTLLILQIPEHLSVIIPVFLCSDTQHLSDCYNFVWMFCVIKEWPYVRVVLFCISKKNVRELCHVWRY